MTAPLTAFRRLIALLTALPRQLIHYFETGDLIPLMIAVSIPHYIGSLAGHDIVPVAIAIALAVDVGQYRLVKAALKYGGNWWWAASAVTLLSFFFHVEYYGGWTWDATVRAAPLPFLIIVLAALSVKENWARKSAPKGDNGNAAGTNGTPAPKVAHSEVPTAQRGTYNDFKLAQLARNGAGAMLVTQIMETYAVPKRTAYRWLEKYHAETLEHAHASVN